MSEPSIEVVAHARVCLHQPAHHDDWTFAVRPRFLIRDYIERTEPLPVDLIHRDLALHMDAAYLANRGQLLRLIRYFRLAALLLMTEVVAWVGSLISQA